MLSKLRWIVLFFILAITSQVAYSQTTMDFLKAKRAKVHFRLINNLIVIPVELNKVSLNFLLDTGMDNTILFDGNQEIVRLNNIQKFKFRSADTNADIEGIRSTENELIVDNQLVFRDKTTFVIFNDNLELSAYMGIPVHGILGYEFFKDFPVEINYDKEIIYVYQKRKEFEKRHKRAKEIPIILEKNKPYINTEISLDNKQKSAVLLLDIGNSNSFYLYEDFVLSDHFSNGMEAYLGQGVRGDIYGMLSRLKEIELVDFKFHEPIISVPFKEHYEGLSTIPNRSGSIGGGIFRRFILYIDYPQKNIYLKKGKSFYEPFHINMSGMEVIYAGMEWDMIKEPRFRNNLVYEDKSFKSEEESQDYKLTLSPAFYVIEVRKNSPADLAGVKKHDKILRINHKSINHQTLEYITQLLRSKEGKTIHLHIKRDEVEMQISFQLQDPLRPN